MKATDVTQYPIDVPKAALSAENPIIGTWKSREIAYLIDQGVVSMADTDAAVCMGPGLRWALMGPNLIYHLGGGPGGIHHLEHFTASMKAYWADLGSPEWVAHLRRIEQKVAARRSRNHMRRCMGW
jgi:hypothetical protein